LRIDWFLEATIVVLLSGKIDKSELAVRIWGSFSGENRVGEKLTRLLILQSSNHRNQFVTVDYHSVREDDF
ncbi:hypothetical protein LINGRAHAP2_LOCUS4114, partial [Linum grandiflorum]